MFQIGARAESTDMSGDFPEYLSLPNETGDNSSSDMTDRRQVYNQYIPEHML